MVISFTRDSLEVPSRGAGANEQQRTAAQDDQARFVTGAARNGRLPSDIPQASSRYADERKADRSAKWA